MKEYSPLQPKGSPGITPAQPKSRVSDSVSTNASIPVQWRWHHRVLLKLQDRLSRSQRGLTQALSQPLESHSMDEADSATDEFDHDLALTQLSTQHDALYEINQALERINRGTYGICEETGKLIPAMRLKAVPWTRFTRKVEKRLEQEKLLHSVRVSTPATTREDGRFSFASEEPDFNDENEHPPV